MQDSMQPDAAPRKMEPMHWVVIVVIAVLTLLIGVSVAAGLSRGQQDAERPGGEDGDVIGAYEITWQQQTARTQFVHSQVGCGAMGYDEAACLDSATTGQSVTLPGPTVTQTDFVCAHDLEEARTMVGAEVTITGNMLDPSNCLG